MCYGNVIIIATNDVSQYAIIIFVGLLCLYVGIS